jgi:hypothetical protein
MNPFDFNWGIFWAVLAALLAAFAIRGALRYYVREKKAERERLQCLKDFPPVPPYNES